MQKKDKLNIGGQAVIEGVLMRSQNYYSIAVRRPDNSISLKVERIKTSKKFSKMIFVRGIVALYETLDIGFKAIMHSAEEAAGEKEKIGKKEAFITIAASVLLALLLFVALPFWLSTLVTKNNSLLFNLIDGAIRTAIFVAYLLIISLIPDVKVMFRYHGAEHMTIHAYEAGKKLNASEARKYPTLHPRCGTSFLLFVLILSILVFSVVTSSSWLIKFASRIILLPVIAGLSYELLKLSAKKKDNPVFKAIISPGLMLQKITTARPNDKQIEVAIKALNGVLDAEKKKSI